jgi:N4-gp56 family major capsid protein
MFSWLKLYFTSPTSLNSMTASDLDSLIPEWWEPKLRVDSELAEFWTKFEGAEGSDSPIIRRNDFTSKAGDVVHVNVMSAIGGAGTSGATELRGKEDKLAFSQFDLKADWLRHAIAWDKRGDARSLFSAITGAEMQLAKWKARRLDDDMFAQLLGLSAQRSMATAETATIKTIYPNAASSVATLSSSDTFGAAEINKIKLSLQHRGALPIQTLMNGKQKIMMYAVVIDDIAAEHYLANDATWNQIQRDAGFRGDENRLFTGALGQYRGVVVYSYGGDQTGRGSFLRPEIKVYAQSVANAAVTFAAASTRSAAIQYFDDGATKYVQTAAATGVATAITMDSGDFSTKMDETDIANMYKIGTHTHGQFEAGDIITAENYHAKAIGFGAEVAARVWGKYPTKVTQTDDYGFVQGLGFESIFGQKCIQDKAANAPNHVVMKHYCKAPFVI